MFDAVLAPMTASNLSGLRPQFSGGDLVSMALFGLLATGRYRLPRPRLELLVIRIVITTT
jgi:hypothetical protein